MATKIQASQISTNSSSWYQRLRAIQGKTYTAERSGVYMTKTTDPAITSGTLASASAMNAFINALNAVQSNVHLAYADWSNYKPSTVTSGALININTTFNKINNMLTSLEGICSNYSTENTCNNQPTCTYNSTQGTYDSTCNDSYDGDSTCDTDNTNSTNSTESTNSTNSTNITDYATNITTGDSTYSNDSDCSTWNDNGNCDDGGCYTNTVGNETESNAGCSDCNTNNTDSYCDECTTNENTGTYYYTESDTGNSISECDTNSTDNAEGGCDNTGDATECQTHGNHGNDSTSYCDTNADDSDDATNSTYSTNSTNGTNYTCRTDSTCSTDSTYITDSTDSTCDDEYDGDATCVYRAPSNSTYTFASTNSVCNTFTVVVS